MKNGDFYVRRPKCPKIAKMKIGHFSFLAIFANFQYFFQFFVQMKAESPYLSNKKFFTPLLVFYPLIFASEDTSQSLDFEVSFSCKIFNSKKGG